MINEGNKISLAIPGIVPPEVTELAQDVIKLLELNTVVDDELIGLIDNGESIDLEPFLTQVAKLLELQAKRNMSASKAISALLELATTPANLDEGIIFATMDMVSGSNPDIIQTMDLLTKTMRLTGAKILALLRAKKWPLSVEDFIKGKQ